MKKDFTKFPSKASDLINQLKAWKKEGLDPLVRELRHLPDAWFSETLQRFPQLERIIKETTEELVLIFNDLTSWQAKSPALASATVPQKEPINLEEIEAALGHLSQKYQALASQEEKEFSPSSLLPKGLPSDIVALVSLNQKAIAECAALYGYSINNQGEKLLALDILSFAASQTVEAKKLALQQLVGTALRLGGKEPKQEIDKRTFLELLRNLAGTLSIQLIRARLGEAIPLAGAIIGSGFNAYFTDKVIDTAQQVYKERYLGTISENTPISPSFPDAQGSQSQFS